MRSLSEFRRPFLEYLGTIRGYSDLTLKSYDETLSLFFEYAEIIQEKRQWEINLMPLRIHISSQKPRTIAKKLSAIRSFVRYLTTQQGLHVSLEADESIKVPKTLPKPVSHEHIMAVLETADLQERCTIMMLYTLGLRISELASLELKNITAEWVRVWGKGNKEREVPLLPVMKDLITDYINQYHPQRYLFERDGTKLSENSLRYVIMKLFKKQGLKVTPHQLRHAYATELLNHNARIADVSELLGHASMATTQIYTKLGSALKLENYIRSHPLCKDSIETDKSV
jgi:integrase/recombinase XerC